MRKKRLNNNLTGAISKGGVLYRPGEVPTLTKEQIAQANLVSKLPKDFPFANWEGMTTKQQLQQMQYSGLNPQDQWSLLNSNVPLVTLNQYNQAQNQSNSTALAARVASSLVNAKAQGAANGKVEAAVGKPTVSTSLQNTGFNGQLGGSVDALAASLKMAALSSNAVEQTNGTIAAKLGGSISTPTRSAGQSPSPTPTPTPSQTSGSASSPNETSQPESAPSPEVTPNAGESTQNNGASEVANADTAYQKDPIEYLFGIDTTYLSEESRNRLYYISRKFYGDGVVPPGLYSSFLNEIGRIKEEMKTNQEAQKQAQENANEEREKAEYFEKIKSAATEDVTWGDEIIYDQGKYPYVEGTFGPKGNLPHNMCGAAAIINANEALGIKTRLDNVLFEIDQNAILTTNLFGTLGMRAGVIEDYYKGAGCKVTRYYYPLKIGTDHDAFIVMYFYVDTKGHIGGHYVAANYDKVNGGFKVFNDLDTEKAEVWDDLTPSSYLKVSASTGRKDTIFFWTVFGIDKPNKPQSAMRNTKIPVIPKGLMKRMSK